MKNITEKSGLLLSLACSLHCIATPFVLSVIPLAAQWEWLHELEIWIVLLSAVLAAILLQKDYRQLHQKIQPILIASLGFLCLTIGALGHFHTLSWVGGVTVVLAYYVNWRFRKNCICSHR